MGLARKKVDENTELLPLSDYNKTKDGRGKR